MSAPASPKPYAMAFIDGQNLFQHAKAAFGHNHPNFDPIKLHNAVCAEFGWSPNLVRFYTGVPAREHQEMWAAYWANRLLAMRRQGVHVTSRPLRYRAVEAQDENGEDVEKWVAQEKGIDVRLALDLVKLARGKQFDVAILFSQDQDLAEVVAEVREIAKEQRRTIDICCPFPFSSTATSRRGVDRTNWFRMEEEFYSRCLDHRDYRPLQYR